MCTHWTLDDPWWPWSDLQSFWHQKLTPPTKFGVHTPMFTHLTLDDPWWPWIMVGTFTSTVLNMQMIDLRGSSDLWWSPYTNVYPFDLRWPLMTLKWPSKFLASSIDPTHQVSCPYTNVYPTLNDPWWPWSDLQNFRHEQLTPPTKFHVHTPMFTPSQAPLSISAIFA